MPAGAITLGDITSADWSLMLDSTAGGAAGAGIGNVVQALQDVNQCVQIILTTPKGSDPLRPTFAIDLWKYVDYPINVATAAIVREVTEAIIRWEPRIELIGVTVAPVVGGSTQSGAHLSVAATWRLKLGAQGSAGSITNAPQVTQVNIIPAAQGF
ncbi:MAG TPA: GPW/gp25 family protein [Candidatus Binataceae bacterium]|nr:GPW/gp25 family protein [Candidatus Binataceae bacterium]